MKPQMERADGARHKVKGVLGDYVKAVTAGWLLTTPAANPGMLEMFRDRDRQPPRNLMPWAGEFAGKYLTAATQMLRLTGDKALRKVLKAFVAQLVAVQSADGYLGPWPSGHHLTGEAPNASGGGATWDAWGHYHAMVGLMMWHELTADDAALDAAQRVADLLCKMYLSRPTGANHAPSGAMARLVDTGSTEMNMAPIHSLACLHNATGTVRYLELAEQLVLELGARGPNAEALAGNYVEEALEGRAFFEMPKPRWESLHPIMGLAELYYATGDSTYRQAFEHIWNSICQLDRHNNGGFSSGEQAQGNPYHRGAIETCCTIAWMAMSVEMLKLTGDPRVADELELSLLNSVIGMHSASGRWATYDTPMDGLRLASAHSIVFQAREGTPELNCCSVNSPRGLGLTSEWALMQDPEGLVLNLYSRGTSSARLANGERITLSQKTGYPREGSVRIRLGLDKPCEFTLKLRIPAWSKETVVLVNGEVEGRPEPGSYFALPRRWKPADLVDLRLDLSLHFWPGSRECEGLTSVYRGPILLTYDRRFNDMDPADVPPLDAATLGRGALAGEVPGGGAPAGSAAAASWTPPPPALLIEFTGLDSRRLRLCDFGSAGEAGTPYRSWLPIVNVPKDAMSPFARDLPADRGTASE